MPTPHGLRCLLPITCSLSLVDSVSVSLRTGLVRATTVPRWTTMISYCKKTTYTSPSADHSTDGTERICCSKRVAQDGVCSQVQHRSGVSNESVIRIRQEGTLWCRRRHTGHPQGVGVAALGEPCQSGTILCFLTGSDNRLAGFTDGQQRHCQVGVERTGSAADEMMTQTPI